MFLTKMKHFSSVEIEIWPFYSNLTKESANVILSSNNALDF